MPYQPVQTIDFNDLPLVSASLQPNDRVPVVRYSDGRLSNVNYSTLTDGVWLQTDVPTAPTSTGSKGMMAANASGLYTHDGVSWGKSIRFTKGWETITENSVFVRADIAQTLTYGEKNQARVNIGIPVYYTPGAGAFNVTANDEVIPWKATTTRQGEVTLYSGSGPKGDTVFTASQTQTAIDSALKYTLPVATNAVLGGIKASDSVNVDNAGVATVPVSVPGTFGIVTKTPTIHNVQRDAATTPDLIKVAELITAAKLDAVDIPNGSYTKTGLVAVNPGSAIYFTASGNGIIDINSANDARLGTVRMAPNDPGLLVPVSGSTTTAYDSRAVHVAIMRDYVALQLKGAVVSVATTSVAGKVMASNSVNVGPTGIMSVPLATASTNGLVKIVKLPGEAGNNVVSAGTSADMETRLKAQIDTLASPAELTKFGSVKIQSLTNDPNPKLTASQAWISEAIANMAASSATGTIPATQTNPGSVLVEPAVYPDIEPKNKNGFYTAPGIERVKQLIKAGGGGGGGGVTSIGGLTGVVNLGTGFGVSGTTITNTGFTSVIPPSSGIGTCIIYRGVQLAYQDPSESVISYYNQGVLASGEYVRNNFVGIDNTFYRTEQGEQRKWVRLKERLCYMLPIAGVPLDPTYHRRFATYDLIDREVAERLFVPACSFGETHHGDGRFDKRAVLGYPDTNTDVFVSMRNAFRSSTFQQNDLVPKSVVAEMIAASGGGGGGVAGVSSIGGSTGAITVGPGLQMYGNTIDAKSNYIPAIENSTQANSATYYGINTNCITRREIPDNPYATFATNTPGTSTFRLVTSNEVSYTSIPYATYQDVNPSNSGTRRYILPESRGIRMGRSGMMPSEFGMDDLVPKGVVSDMIGGGGGASSPVLSNGIYVGEPTGYSGTFIARYGFAYYQTFSWMDSQNFSPLRIPCLQDVQLKIEESTYEGPYGLRPEPITMNRDKLARIKDVEAAIGNIIPPTMPLSQIKSEQKNMNSAVTMDYMMAVITRVYTDMGKPVPTSIA